MKTNKRGFTVVELLVVLVILGILITLAYMGVSQYMKQARDTVYEDFEKNITSKALTTIAGPKGMYERLSLVLFFKFLKISNRHNNKIAQIAKRQAK